VLGDMGEVGAQGPAFHAEVGRYAKEKGIDVLLALGSASKDSVTAFGSGATLFEDLNEIPGRLKNIKTILVKGSRFMRMERVVALLAGERAAVH
jgi:murE/murF fusion protein